LGSQLTLKCWHFQQSGRVPFTDLAGDSGILELPVSKCQCMSKRLLQQLEHRLLAGVGLGQHCRGSLLHDLRA